MLSMTTVNIAAPTNNSQPVAAPNLGIPEVTEQGNLVFKGIFLKPNSFHPEELAIDKDQPPSVRELREHIKRLQKQLIQEQKQLAQLQLQASDDPSKMVEVQAKQASIVTLTGLIMAATSQLMEALNKIGGSSAGGMVDIVA